MAAALRGRDEAKLEAIRASIGPETSETEQECHLTLLS
jgi:short subunit dehydrogenase-like uncharacterized protein